LRAGFGIYLASIGGVKNLALPVIITGLIATCAYCAEPNARQIVQQSINNYEKDWNAALDFTYTEHDVTRSVGGQQKSVEVSQVSVLAGTPYSRLIAKNGHTLTPDEEMREADKYRRAVDVRDHETPAQHDRRLRKYGEERAFLHEIPDAFDMKPLGQEAIDGRPNYVIRLTPKEGYVAKAKNARMFSDIEGKLWIDEQDLRWTKAVADVIDTISIGWVVARIGPGAHITMTQVKVDGEHWMPKEIDISGSARIMLVKNRLLDESVSFADYRRVRPPAPTAAAKNR
jgi:hypothetical protein